MATKQYGWKDISVVILGRTIEGITDVKVKRKTSKDFQMGRGNESQAIISGNQEVTGTITIHQSELQAIDVAIKATNPTLDITKVSFDVVINYENGLGVAATDSIIGVEVEEYEKGMSQGDKMMNITMPFKALRFIENIP